MEKKGITVAGSLIVDEYYMTDTYPDIGRLTNIREVTKGVGGAGNLIQDLAKLDAELCVKVSGLIGNDGNGMFAKKILGTYKNIDLSNVRQSGKTSMTLVIEPRDTRQRTFFYLPAASNIYNESYIDWEVVDADIFHLEYLLLMKQVDAWDEEYGTHGARILHEARRRGMKTSIDMVSEDSGRVKEVVCAALRYTDYCTINEMEAESITGVPLLVHGEVIEENLPKALTMLRNMGVNEWGIIHSPKCSWGIHCESGDIVKVESLHLPKGYIKGTTGAGDAYCSGILYGAYQGKCMEEAMKLGTACAACSLSRTGGSEGLREYKEVIKVYERYKTGRA